MNRPNFEAVLVDSSLEPVLANLFAFYLHDMAQWFQFDQAPTGDYPHSYARYWQDDHHVYLLYANNIPVGFCVVATADDWFPEGSAMDIEEFFIVRRHRRSGVGREFARHVWDEYPVRWLVRVLQGNLPAIPFWREIIDEYSGGSYQEDTLERNDNLWSHFTFIAAEVS